jgi:large subunit ribosomal protein L15
VGFEGGQMPLQRRLPKVGFSSRVNNYSAEIKYDRLEKIKEDEVTIELLKKYKLIKSQTKKVKVIGPCTIKSKKVLKDVSCTKSVTEHLKK